MSQPEQDRIIVAALQERTEAKRKLSVLTEHLRYVGQRLASIASALNPMGNAVVADETCVTNLHILDNRVLEVLDREKLLALISERNQLEESIRTCTAKLESYGAE
jgi:hypothetical protein